MRLPGPSFILLQRNDHINSGCSILPTPNSAENSVCQPVLKWPGGKRALVKQLAAFVPAQFGTYIEPFCGGAALFFALQPNKAIVSDSNPELINFYRTFRARPRAIIKASDALSNSERQYYQLRRQLPKTSLKKAIRFLYLNRASFAGLYRTNRNGVFNVPFGNNGRRIIPSSDALLDSARVLRGAILVCEDFETTCSRAKKGDFVYLDPPYTVAHENNGFIKYNASIFTWEDQLRLKVTFDRLVTRGVHVLMTNAAHESIRQLYSEYAIRTVQRSSTLATDIKCRKRVREFAIVGVP